MPMICKGLDPPQYNELRKTFVTKLAKVFENFYDFKISSEKYTSGSLQADFFCKLVSKHIVLLLEVPATELLSEQLEC